MAQYVVMHTLIHHRQQRMFDAWQKEKKWRQTILPRRTEDTRIGILGLGEIGTMAAERLRDLDFQMAGWSRTRKDVPGVKSFAGDERIERVPRPQRYSHLPVAADAGHAPHSECEDLRRNCRAMPL